MARALLEYETIDAAEVELICRGEKLVRAPKAQSNPTDSGSGAVATVSDAKTGSTHEGSGGAAPVMA